MLKIFLLACLTVNLLVESFPLDDTVIEEHIIGGNDTDISKVPYQVAMYEGPDFVCGGFIVSPTHVVTAGHCGYGKSGEKTSIRAGSSSNKEGGVVVNVKKIYIHPKFNLFTADFDVSVLELKTPLKFTDKIKPIKLATTEPATGSPLLVSGWGVTSIKGDKPKTLQSVILPVVDRAKCQVVYEPTSVRITSGKVCAGDEGKFAYSGDSGSPAVYKGEVVGIFSLSLEIREKSVPGVYTNVVNSKINKFIKDIANL